MITSEKLPTEILDKIAKYKKHKEKTHVFPSVISINNINYYYIKYAPSREQLIIREDGTILPVSKIKSVFQYALVYNTSFENITNFGLKWVESGTLKRYEKLCNILEDLYNVIKEQAPSNILDSLKRFRECSEIIIQEQHNINKSVGQGFDLANKTNNLEIVTIQDCKEMRKFNESMVRAAFRQNEIQLETEDERKVIYKYVSRNKFSYGFKLLPILIQLAPYHKNMRTSATIGSEEMEDIKRLISKDLNIEENPEALAAVKLLRNPIK
ncbi:hypothetical protein ABID52_003883 [Fictibacillus halophilus]|uniref:Uncharacterized protein n=1 Tax=Fictibacillus halophilus TaxID=1610490 RepID=A0ABV2LNS8_9BACL|nr:hypothetical protein [Fictibacillus halophilus]